MRATVTLAAMLLLCAALVGCGKDEPAKTSSGGGKGGGNTGTTATPSNPTPNGGTQPTPPVAAPKKGWNGFKWNERTRGVEGALVVTEVSPNSPAERAGLKVGDLILRKNREPVTTAQAFYNWIITLTPDTRYTLSLQHEGKEIEVTLTVGIKAESAEGGGKNAPPQALEAGMKWLADEQLGNGAWPHVHKSVIHQEGTPNPAITGLALSALSSTSEGRARYATQIAKGIEYLLSRETPKGYIAEESDAMRYGNFATAYALLVMCRVDKVKYREPIQKLVGYFERSQIGEAHGFERYDWPFGAWDYFDDIRQSRLRADIVLASLVIDALHAAGVPPTSKVMKNALKYVKRCQNYKDDVNQLTDLDDGGFFFTPREGKAGDRGVGDETNRRYNSYGSVTLDGIRSLILLGEAKDSPRVKAARDWMADKYSLEVVPGFAPEALVDFAHGLRYYYYMQMAKTLAAVGEPTMRTSQGTEIKWMSDLAGYVAGIQHADGSWANSVSIMNEDDPIIATGMAIHALAIALGHAQ